MEHRIHSLPLSSSSRIWCQELISFLPGMEQQRLGHGLSQMSPSSGCLGRLVVWNEQPNPMRVAGAPMRLWAAKPVASALTQVSQRSSLLRHGLAEGRGPWSAGSPPLALLGCAVGHPPCSLRHGQVLLPHGENRLQGISDAAHRAAAPGVFCPV